MASLDAHVIFSKMKTIAKKAGRAVVLSALTFWYAFRDPEVPRKIKAIILGDLAYFISPIDLVPDFIPGIGFSDDLAVFTATAVLIAKYIKKDHIEQAKATSALWFGEP